MDIQNKLRKAAITHLESHVTKLSAASLRKSGE